MPTHNVLGNESPWVEQLSELDRKQCQKELLDCVAKSVASGDWVGLEDLIQDWRATAETERSPEIVRELTDRARRSEYVVIK